MSNIKRAIPDFILDYEKHLKQSAQAINKRVKKGDTITYAGYTVTKVLVEGFRTSGFGTSEAYVFTKSISDNDKKWNAGSDIFSLLTIEEKFRILG